VFNGANINENMDISANGQRVRLSRDVGNVVMDLNGVEHIQVNALGGADTITVNDLTGTDATRVALDLSAPTGSGQGDGQPDTSTAPLATTRSKSPAAAHRWSSTDWRRR